MTESNPSPFTSGAVPAHVEKDAGDLHRAAMNVWAEWAVSHRSSFSYTEGASRWHMVESAPGSLPQFADCSAFVTGLARWVGAADPNGLGYHAGFTGTLLAHCNRIPLAAARQGDLIVYGPGVGRHVVFISERLPRNDFWVVSHGHPGDPGRYTHSKFQTYFGGTPRFLRWLS